MKNILVGNGINIEFGGKDYCNSEIITRLLSNLQKKDYADIFAHEITNNNLGEIIYGLHGELKHILKGLYDRYCTDEDEKTTLRRIKKQYTVRSSIFDIVMEDYFFILRLFHKRFNDPQEMIKATYDGFCWLLLDAIYNNGQIQKIHENIKTTKKDRLQSLFSQFDNIFTVNYDCNIEMIAEKPVYYLHGDFNTLHDQYNAETLIGRMYLEKGIPNPVTDDTKQIYCNGIMGFTGSFKENVIDTFKYGSFGLEQIMKKFNKGLSIEDEKQIEQMRTSSDERLKFAYGIIQTKRKFPQLTFHQYPCNIFREISGEISIVGLSPNNDDHIWKMIKENSQIHKIVYYYKSGQDKNAIDDLYSDMNIVTFSIDQLW